MNEYKPLEDALAEEPFDEERWLVLEDWLLENADPRAKLVELEKQHLPTRDLLAELAPRLLGPQHAKLRNHLYQVNWRAGYLRECQFTGTSELIALLVAAPATRLLRSLALTGHLAALAAAVTQFAEAPCGRSLRILTLSSWSESEAISIRNSTLEQLPEIRHLILRGLYVDVPPRLAKLEALTLAPMRLGVQRLHEQLKHHRWPHLTEATLELPEMHETDWNARLPVVLAGVSPELRRLRVLGLPPERVRIVEGHLAELARDRRIEVELRAR